MPSMLASVESAIHKDGKSRNREGNFLASAQWDEAVIAKRQIQRNALRTALQGDAIKVSRKLVKVCAVVARECFQPIKLARRIEGLSIQLDRGMRRVNAGATACRFLCMSCMRRTVGS